MEKHHYNVQVDWNTDRKGMLCSPELKRSGDSNCIEVATPPEFPKGMPGIWSPEHLFTAAVASCLMTTFLSIADHSKLVFMHFGCTAEGVLEEVDGRLIISEVILRPVVTIADEKDRERTLRVLQKSESACLISHSVKSKVAMIPSVMIAG